MKKTHSLLAFLVGVAGANGAVIDSSFTNLDFDSNTQSQIAAGFDMPAYDTPGWRDFGTINDAGVEFEGAWWSPYEQYSAFVRNGNGAYNVSTYTIQSGDVFEVSLVAKGWQTFANTAGAELTITVFFGSDPSTNILGSFNTGVLPQGDTFATWQSYSDTIAATPASVGEVLGVSVLQTSSINNTFGQFDEVSINVVPEPTVALLGSLGLMGLMFRRR